MVDTGLDRVHAQFVHRRPGASDYVRRGLSEDEAVKEPLAVVKDVDPYPIGQRLFPRSDWVTEANIRNLYKRILARIGASV